MRAHLSLIVVSSLSLAVLGCVMGPEQSASEPLELEEKSIQEFEQLETDLAQSIFVDLGVETPKMGKADRGEPSDYPEAASAENEETQHNAPAINAPKEGECVDDKHDAFPQQTECEEPRSIGHGSPQPLDPGATDADGDDGEESEESDDS